jgi:hypothetical protein
MLHSFDTGSRKKRNMYIHTYTHTYVHIGVCMCVCIYIYKQLDEKSKDCLIELPLEDMTE